MCPRRADRLLARQARGRRHPVWTGQLARELPADAQLAAVDFFPLAQHPSEGSIRMVRPPVRFGDADCALRYPAPRLGQHSRVILREAGFSAPEIDDLLARRVAIEAEPN